MTQPATQSSRPLAETRARLHEIIRKRSFGLGDITLASGRKSDFYFNLKPTMLDAEGAALLAELTLDALAGERIDYVGGLEMGAVPLAGAIAQLSFMRGQPIQAFFVRKKPKEHGARLAVEGLAPGESLSGKRVVIVEDVTTTGGSAIKAVDAVRESGAEIVMVLTMVDREEGADRDFPRAGLRFPFALQGGRIPQGAEASLSPWLSSRLLAERYTDPQTRGVGRPGRAVSTTTFPISDALIGLRHSRMKGARRGSGCHVVALPEIPRHCGIGRAVCHGGTGPRARIRAEPARKRCSAAFAAR